MKKIIVVLALAVALCLPQMADAALQVTFTGNPKGYGPYQTGIGGEFTLLPTGFAVSGYSASTSDLSGSGTFQTFCLEVNEHISGNTTYDVVFNTKAVQGGVGPLGDPISIGTAWLYSQFAQGTLAGYDYTDPGRSGAGNSADLLQQAIWMLEGEQAVNTSNYYYALAMSSLVLDANHVKDDANGAYGVMVLNLYADGHAGDPNYLRQDQLVYVPEPATVLLLGLGMMGLAGIRKKMKRF